MYYVYIIESELTDRYYIGYTIDYVRRWTAHKYTSKHKKSKLYDCINKYGFDNFELVVIKAFQNKQEAIDYERSLISLDDEKCLNLVPGGEGGFIVQDRVSWIDKLKIAREGRKPALGLKHTEENKLKFSQLKGSKYDIKGLSFKEANEQLGVSKTHYYRLLKQIKSNELN